MIKPTIGRVVWYRAEGDDIALDSKQPLAALITYVHSDTMVNLVVFDPNGNPRSRTSVWLWDGECEKRAGSYAEWMPYQKGQAAKTESAEAELKQMASAGKPLI